MCGVVGSPLIPAQECHGAAFTRDNGPNQLFERYDASWLWLIINLMAMYQVYFYSASESSTFGGGSYFSKVNVRKLYLYYPDKIEIQKCHICKVMDNLTLLKRKETQGF